MQWHADAAVALDGIAEKLSSPLAIARRASLGEHLAVPIAHFALVEFVRDRFGLLQRVLEMRCSSRPVACRGRGDARDFLEEVEAAVVKHDRPGVDGLSRQRIELGGLVVLTEIRESLNRTRQVAPAPDATWLTKFWKPFFPKRRTGFGLAKEGAYLKQTPLCDAGKQFQASPHRMRSLTSSKRPSAAHARNPPSP